LLSEDGWFVPLLFFIEAKGVLEDAWLYDKGWFGNLLFFIEAKGGFALLRPLADPRASLPRYFARALPRGVGKRIKNQP
jgi:hypothetical protein